MGSAQVACRQEPRLVGVADRAMRCRHLQPPDLDVSVLVGERALHNLVVKLWWPVGLVRFKIGKLHRRAFPPSYGHSFKSPGPGRAARAAAQSSVAAAVLAPRCRRRFATWWEASDTDLVGGFSKRFERFRKPTAVAREWASMLPSQELPKELHIVWSAPLNHRISPDSAALSACKAQ